MMTSVSSCLDESRQQTAKTAKSIAMATELLRSGNKLNSTVLRVVYWTVRSLITEKKAIRVIRKAMAECSESCEDGGCLRELLPIIQPPCDFFADLVKTYDRMPPLFKPLKTISEIMLTDWSDLVEDCLIASDPEIRASITRIAQNC